MAADKQCQMRVTLTDGTILDAGQFTVPGGATGPAGADGVTPLQCTKVLQYNGVPTTNSTFQTSSGDFNRLPVAGERFVAFIQDVADTSRIFICNVNVTAVTAAVGCTVTTSTEIGKGIKSVAITEVSA